MEKEEIKYINYQLFGLSITLLTTIIGLIITYNQKLGMQEKEKLMTNKESLQLTYINRIFILLVALLFFYVNYQFLSIQKKEQKDTKGQKLQILASCFTITSAIIALYVVTLSTTETLSDVENPTI